MRLGRRHGAAMRGDAVDAGMIDRLTG